MDNKDTKVDKRLTQFRQAIDHMVATSEKTYTSTNNNFRKGLEINQYTKDEILQIVDEGDPAELKKASLYFSYSSGFYRRFLAYYSTLLKYIYMLVPHVRNGRKIEDNKNVKRYESALAFMESLNLKNLCVEIAYTVLSEGAYYGWLCDFGKDGAVVQRLSSDYCRSRFKNQYDVSVVEFNLDYFDRIYDKKNREAALASFPAEIARAYNQYKNNKRDKWYMLPVGGGLYFKLFDERPFFSSILPAVLDFKDYREIEKDRDMQDLKKLLIQRMPLEDGELVFDPDEIEEFHRGVVGMTKNTPNLDVITTVAEVKVEDMESNRSVVANNLEKISQSIYEEAGVSKELFAADGNTALNHSITNDTSLMMVLANDIANWVQYNVNERFSDGAINFKVTALPFTYYNEDDQRGSALSLAQSGYSFLIPALAFNMNQSDLSDIKNLEQKVLKLSEIMIPLASSYTTSSGNPMQAGKESEVPDTEKSDKTIQNIESGREGE